MNEQDNLSKSTNYLDRSTSLDDLDYFKNPTDVVPIGDLIGMPSLNCTSEEFKSTLLEALDRYHDAFEILRME